MTGQETKNSKFAVGLTACACLVFVACGTETTEPPDDEVNASSAEVTVSPLGASLSGVGSTHSFQAEARDSSGNAISSPTVTWSSLNPNVATIDANGTATAVTSGQVTIAAEVDGVRAYALLTVSVPGVAAVGSLTEDLSESLTLRGLWGASDDDLFAVGRDGAILRFDGVEWATMESGTNHHLRTVWGTSADNVYAAGIMGQVLHFDGVSWNQVRGPIDYSISRIWGTSPIDIIGVGPQTIIHYDGVEWNRAAFAEITLNGIWGTSSSDIFAVGDDGIIMHFDGAGWSQMTSGTSNHLQGVWGTSPNEVFAAGYEGELLCFDGTTWQTWQTVPGNPDGGWNTIWGTSSEDIYIGSYLQGLVFHWDGLDWTEMSNYGGNHVVTGLWGTSQGAVYAIQSLWEIDSEVTVILRGER